MVDSGFKKTDGKIYSVSASLTTTRPSTERGLELLDELDNLVKLQDQPGNVSPRRISTGSIEQNRISFELMEEVYRNDGMMFNTINALSNWSVAKGWFLRGSDKDRKTVEEFLSHFQFRQLLIDIVRHLHIYGNAFIEISRTKNGIPYALHILDPKLVDFKRTGGTAIELDKFGDPKTYTYQGGTGILKDIDSKDIIHFKVNRIADSFWGIGVIEPLYNIIKIKKNIEVGLGEAIWRVGFPWVIVKVGDADNEPSQAQISEEGANFADVSSKNALVVPYFYDIKFIESSALENAGRYFEYFEGQIMAGTAVPKSIAMGVGDDSNRSTARAQQENFAIVVMSVQSLIAEKLERKVFDELVNGHVDLKFEDIISQEPLERAKTDQIEIEAGIKTVAEARAERGRSSNETTSEPTDNPKDEPEDEPEEDPEDEPEDGEPADEESFTDIQGIRDSFTIEFDKFVKTFKESMYSKILDFESEDVKEKLDSDPLGVSAEIFEYGPMPLFDTIYKNYSFAFLKGAQAGFNEMGVKAHKPTEAKIYAIQMHCMNIAKDAVHKVLQKLQYALVDNFLSDGDLSGMDMELESIFAGLGGPTANKNSSRDLIVDTETSRGLNRGKLWAYSTQGKKTVKVITRRNEMKCRKCRKHANKEITISAAQNLLPIHPHCTCEFTLTS